MSMDGLADYSRNSGYVSGDVTLTNETITLNYDRGRKFTIVELVLNKRENIDSNY